MTAFTLVTVAMLALGALAPSGRQNVHASSQPGSEAAAIHQWLDGYDAAFIAKDLDMLATYYQPTSRSTRVAASTTGGPTTATVISGPN